VVQFQAGTRDVSLLQTFQTGTGTHPAFCSMLIEESVHGVMQPKRKSDNSPPSSVKVKKVGNCRHYSMWRTSTNFYPHIRIILLLPLSLHAANLT